MSMQQKCAVILCLALQLSCSTKTGAEGLAPNPKSAPEVKTKPVSVPAEAAWPMFRGGPRRNGRSDVKGPRRANPMWAFRTQGRIYADPTLARDGTVYVASQDGFLYAVGPGGKEKWSFDAKGKIWSTPSVAEDGTVYFGSDADKFYALHPDGTLKWELSTTMPPEKKGEKVSASQWDVDTSPAIGRDGTVYFACHYFLYAVAPSGTPKWRFQAGQGRSKIFSSPAVDSDGTVYFGNQADRLFSVDGTGKLRWSVETGGDNDSAPAVEGDTVYFGSDDGKVRALFTSTGLPKWETDLHAPIRAPISVGHKGAVYTATYGEKPFVVSLDASTGEERFRFYIEPGEGAFYGIESGVLVDKDEYLYFGGRDHFVYCLTPDGKLSWRSETGDQVDSGPVLDKNGTLYVGSDDRRLTAFGR